MQKIQPNNNSDDQLTPLSSPPNLQPSEGSENSSPVDWQKALKTVLEDEPHPNQADSSMSNPN